MPSDLSPSEKEDQEVERLIDKEPAPSRKHTERRGPKYDNRRRRMKVDDDDIKPPVEGDQDLSLNWKSQGSLRRRALALLVTADSLEKIEGREAELIQRLRNSISSFDEQLRDLSPALADDFFEYALENYVEPANEGWSDKKALLKDIREVDSLIADFKSARKDVSGSFLGANRDKILKVVNDNWPSGKRGWPVRAALISAVRDAIDQVKIPEALKLPFLRGSAPDVMADRELVRKFIESTGRGSLADVDEKSILAFAQLAAVNGLLRDNPASISLNELASGMDELAADIRDQSKELIELGAITDAWQDAMSGFRPVEESDGPSSPEELNRVLADLDSFFSRSNLVDPSSYMAELSDYAEANFDRVPDGLKDMFDSHGGSGKGGSGRDKAASYGGIPIEAMARRTATYHGVEDLSGNPQDPINTPWRSHDKRYFTEDNYKSILKYAGTMLEDDWVRHGWDGGADDAPLRAALDLAIHLADGSLYQSKIDVETYDMLLNRLAKWGHDSFSETVIPQKAKRKASDMQKTESYQNIVRIASELRKTDPSRSLEILKSLQDIRSMVSSKAPEGDDISRVALDAVGEEHVAPSAAGYGSGDETVAKAPGDDLTFQSMSEDDFEALKKEAEKSAKDLFDADDIEAFMEAFDNLVQDVEKKTAATFLRSVPISVLIKMAVQDPDAKRVLGPVIVAAAKKSKKTKTSKKGEKGDDEKGDNPFGGKKAPPFGKGKGKKKGKKKGKGKKKTSLSFTQQDFAW